jgi:hypothetical protein
MYVLEHEPLVPTFNVSRFIRMTSEVVYVGSPFHVGADTSVQGAKVQGQRLKLGMGHAGSTSWW